MNQVTDNIRIALRQTPGCSLDDLIRACPTLGWNEIFFELDRMSRSGELLLTDHGHGRYSLRLVQEPTDACAELESLSHSSTVTQEERS